jgi:hypothetical protein
MAVVAIHLLPVVLADQAVVAVQVKTLGVPVVQVLLGKATQAERAHQLLTPAAAGVVADQVLLG